MVWSAMKIGRRALVALALMPGTVWAQNRLKGLSTWYIVQADDKAFTVEMPGVPDHRLINDASARGTSFVLHSYSLDYEGQSFVAQTALYPTDVDTRQPRGLLQAALNARAQRLAGGKWSTVSWRAFKGLDAVESTGTLANGSGLRQFSTLKGQRFVSLAVLGPGVAGHDADRFFHSLKIL
jgi:hypothetical protein